MWQVKDGTVSRRWVFLRTAVQRRGHGLDVVGTCAQIPPPESLPARTATSLWSRSEIVESNSREERKFYRKENYWARCTKCFLSTTVSRLSQAQGFFQHFMQYVLIDSKDQNTKLFKHLEHQFRNSQSTLPISTIWQAAPVPTARMLQTMLEGVSFPSSRQGWVCVHFQSSSEVADGCSPSKG